nr:MAG TPA: hypothetical protein [Caudoviricetes sp.]
MLKGIFFIYIDNFSVIYYHNKRYKQYSHINLHYQIFNRTILFFLIVLLFFLFIFSNIFKEYHI